MPTQAFINLRNKYPQYDNLDDKTLIDKVVTKYPQYKESLVPNIAELTANADEANRQANLPIPKESAVGQLVGGIVNPLYRVGANTLQGVEQIATGKQGTTYTNPITGDIVKPETSVKRAVGTALQTSALGFGGGLVKSALSGAGYGAGQAMSEDKGPTEIAVNAVAGGVLGGALHGASKVPEVISDYSKISKSPYFIQENTERLKQNLNNAKRQVGEKVGEVIRDYKNVKVSQQAHDNINSNITPEIKKLIEKPGYGIQFDKDGNIVNNLENLQKAKEAIDQETNFLDSTKGSLRNDMKKVSRTGIRNAMVEVVPELKPKLDAYHNFLENTDDILRPKLNDEKMATRTFSYNASQKVKRAWDNLKNLNPDAEIPMHNLTQANIRRGISPATMDITKPLNIARNAWELKGIRPYKALPENIKLQEPPKTTALTVPQEEFAGTIPTIELGAPRANLGRIPLTPLLEAPEQPIGTKYGEGFVTKPKGGFVESPADHLKRENEAIRQGLNPQEPNQAGAEAQQIMKERIKDMGKLGAGVAGAVLAGESQAKADEIKNLKTGTKLSGKASTYGWSEKLNDTTFKGEKFDKMALTAAMRNIPMGSRVKVTDKKTGKSVVVQVNDGGPAHKTGKVIDLTQGAWRSLGYDKPGDTDVDIEVLTIGGGKKYLGHELAKRKVK